MPATYSEVFANGVILAVTDCPQSVGALAAKLSMPADALITTARYLQLEWCVPLVLDNGTIKVRADLWRAFRHQQRAGERLT